MPFIPQEPRQFNKFEVESVNPNQSGVYGIFRQGQWIYVGKGDIKQRLISHLNGDNPLILLNNPTLWVAEVFPGDPSIREKQLIMELNPSCNQRIG